VIGSPTWKCQQDLRILEAVQSRLLGDISGIRQAILKGSQLSPRDREKLIEHLQETRVLLVAATRAYQEMISSITEPMQFERRRVSRHAFGGVAEMSASHSHSNIIGLTAEIGRFGCFVRTCASMPVGTKINLKINYEGNEVRTPGEVVYVLPEKGLGIKFAKVAAKDTALLEMWLRQT
jgi:hypothetical protein